MEEEHRKKALGLKAQKERCRTLKATKLILPDTEYQQLLHTLESWLPKRSPEKSYSEAAKAGWQLQQTEEENNYSSYTHPKLKTGLNVEARH